MSGANRFHALTLIWIRSALFQAAFYVNFIVFCILGLPLLAVPRRVGAPVLSLWALTSQKLLQAICGITYEVRGRANMPRGAAIVAAKHQSQWETLSFLYVLDDPAIVLKRELARVPVFGWYALKFGHLAIDRRGGPMALRRLMGAARRAVADARPIVIFPEGTRRAPGAPPSYQPGVAALYRGLGIPCVPVALNSGLYLLQPGWLKFPGRIVVEFLEPISPGLDGGAFLTELEGRIEGACSRLFAEAGDSGAIDRAAE